MTRFTRWNDHLPIGDLMPDLDSEPKLMTPEQISELARGIAARLRTVPQWGTDLVLRSLAGDLTQAGAVTEFDRDWNLIAMWADQEEVRLLLCTGSTTVTKPGRPFCRQCVDWFTMHPAHHPAFEHPDLVEAVATWCELTCTEADEVRVDADFVQVAGLLDDAELLGFRNHDGHDGTISPTAYANAARRAALVLLAGAELASLRGTPVAEATARVWAHVRDHLGQPTGYEGEPDRLARLIHSGTPREKM